MWDTLGQEKYKALAPLFFRKAVGALLVYDCTSRESFEALDGWLAQLSSNSDTRVVVMLLGNKCDLPGREVPYNVAMEYARARNIGFVEVSAKTGMNVRNAFNCLTREIFRAGEEGVAVPLEAEEVKRRTEPAPLMGGSELVPHRSRGSTLQRTPS